MQEAKQEWRKAVEDLNARIIRRQKQRRIIVGLISEITDDLTQYVRDSGIF